MFEYDYENEDKALKLVGLELMFLTPEKYSNPQGITAVELSKRVGLELDVVKKKLKVLPIKNLTQGAHTLLKLAEAPKLL